MYCLEVSIPRRGDLGSRGGVGQPYVMPDRPTERAGSYRAPQARWEHLAAKAGPRGCRRAVLCLLCVLLTAPFHVASAAVVSYTVVDDDGQMVLTSVSTGGADQPAVIYDARKLIPVQVTHFRAASTLVLCVPSGSPIPTRAMLPDLLDGVLNSGLVNVGAAAGTGGPLPDGMGLRFAQPVANRPGDDIVFFELHTRANSPVGGDPFIVTAQGGGAACRPRRIEAFDLTLEHPKAQSVFPCRFLATPRPPETLDQIALDAMQPAGGSDSMPFKVLAAGVDLSDLGIAAGATITEIVVHNVAGRGAAPDFVCVAGLPEPVRPNVLAAEPQVTAPPPKPVLAPMLTGPLARVREVVFAVRRPGTDHWYANFGFYSAPTPEYPPQRAPGGAVRLPTIYKSGGSLRALDLRTRQTRLLLDDPEGALRDPCVHYDGVTILFSWRQGGSDFYHLYEINADGSGLRQITAGPHNDIEPVYLPDGAIMFCSDRCNRFVNCWRTPVATLYRCAADGSGLRMISSNIEHDNTPWVLPDGRVLYMRWEYVDRNQNVFHHLWTAGPDGTGQMVYFGNMHPGTAMLDAKPVPGSRAVVASFSPGHGQAEHAGHITLVDPRQGPDHQPSAVRISRGEPVYRDPYPIATDCYLVAAERRLLVMDGRGRTEDIYGLPETEKGTWVHEPRPLVPRPCEPVVPQRIIPGSATGTFFLSDVAAGRNLAGLRRGEVRQLLVLEQLPKPVNFSGGMWPISAGGTFTLARILGVVPVSEDGSAEFEAPALRSLFFVALDGNGLAIKRMHSFTTLQPGESMGCVGCHEPRASAPPHALPRRDADLRRPDQIAPLPGIPDVPDFPRDIQPILDAHCVRCHNPTAFKGSLELTGDRTPIFSQSYWALTQRGLYVDGRNAMRGNDAPRVVGSAASKLLGYLDGSHHSAKPSATERATVRLWIDAGAPFAGTYAALGSGMATVDFPEAAFERRCAACHGRNAGKDPLGGQGTVYRFGKAGPYLPLVHSAMHLRDIRARVGYFQFGQARPPQSLCNLSHPEASLLLRAHLAREAGGLELGGKRIFTAVADPDYQDILQAIQAAAARLLAEKRFDMPDFRPNDYYLHQLVRYGILDGMPPPGPVDPYPLDRLYWASFHCR